MGALIREFGRLKSVGKAAWEACSATWKVGTNSAFAQGLRKTTENLSREGRSQDLPSRLTFSVVFLSLSTKVFRGFP
jgi:hypothetical protein